MDNGKELVFVSDVRFVIGDDCWGRAKKVGRSLRKYVERTFWNRRQQTAVWKREMCYD